MVNLPGINRNNVGQSKSLSLYMVVTIVYITHSLINALILSPLFPPLGCNLYYKTAESCTADELWILGWKSYCTFTVSILLMFMAISARHSIILEKRLAYLIATRILSQLSNGALTLDTVHSGLATLQASIYTVMLSLLALHSATAPPTIPLPSELKSCSFDKRRRLSIATIAVIIQLLVCMTRLVDLVFDPDSRVAHLGTSVSPLSLTLYKLAVSEYIWICVILGYSILLATVEQQKALLKGQVVALFVYQVIAFATVDRFGDDRIRASLFGNFFTMLVALTGAL